MAETPKLNLYKPADDEINWGIEVNENWDTLDNATINPMTTAGDIIVATTDGEPARLAAGAAGQILSISSGSPAWIDAPEENPMTTTGDMIVGGASGTPTRLAVGTTGKVIVSDGTNPVWDDAPTPMTTVGDIIVGGVSGASTRLGAGEAGQVLTMSGGTPAWQDPPEENPMTTAGDMVMGGASGTPTRIGIGSSGQILTVTDGAPAWGAAPQSLPAGGTTDQVLSKIDGTDYNVQWSTPATVTPSSATPEKTIEGTGQAGSSTDYSRADHSHQGNLIVRYKSANQTLTSTSFVNDTHLNFPMEANAVYAIQVQLFNTFVNGPDLAVGFSGPAGVSFVRGVLEQCLDGHGAIRLSTITGYSQTAGFNFGANGDAIHRIDVTVGNGATAGTLYLRLAKLITHASSQTIDRGSYLVARRIG